jgi:hypothetical protein
MKGRPIPGRSRVLIEGVIMRTKRRHRRVNFSTAGGDTETM